MSPRMVVVNIEQTENTQHDPELLSLDKTQKHCRGALSFTGSNVFIMLDRKVNVSDENATPTA